MQEILQPLDAYRNELRDAHAKNTAEFFEELLRQSGVDEQANAATVDRLNQTLEELTASQSNTRWLGIARMLLVLGMIAAAIAAYQDHPLWAIGCVLALLLIFQGINPRLQAARQRTAMLEAQRAQASASRRSRWASSMAVRWRAACSLGLIPWKMSSSASTQPMAQSGWSW